MELTVRVFLAAILLLSLAVPTQNLWAQEPEAAPKIAWQAGPVLGKLGNHAEIKIPEGYMFAGADGAKTFLELTQNIPSGNELGVIIPLIAEEDEDTEMWFVIFEFDAAGYVKDDEKDDLDGDAILSSIRQGTEQANKIRLEKGWPILNIDGWEKEPYYDSRTNNLTWAIRATSQ